MLDAILVIIYFVVFLFVFFFFFFSSRRRHTRSLCDWSSDVCSSDLVVVVARVPERVEVPLHRLGIVHISWTGKNPCLYRLCRDAPIAAPDDVFNQRSEERRVGKECRYRWSRCR